MSSEQPVSTLLYQDGSVSISRSMAKFGSTSYPIANIGSVTVNITGSAKSIPTAIFFAVLAVLSLFIHWVLALILGAVAVVKAFVDSRQYTLMLKTSSGDVQAMQTKDAQKVDLAKTAIEKAFDLRS